MDAAQYYKVPAKLHDYPSAAMQALAEVCYQWGGVDISAYDFYREIFPEGLLQPRLHYNADQQLISADGEIVTPEPTGKDGNAVMVMQRGRYIYPGQNPPKWCKSAGVTDTERYITRVVHRVLYDDLDIDQWQNLNDIKHVWCSGLLYIGKKARLSSAVAMQAMIIDLDYITPTELHRFLWACENKDILTYPRPNYITITGNGIHLYYVFWEPLPLFHGAYGHKVKSQLNTLKHALITKLWNEQTVSDARGKKPQYQSIAQPFRMVGTYSKALTLEHDRYKVIGVKFPFLEPLDGLDYLYQYTRIPKEDRYREKSVFGVDFWKERNPAWYERRVIQKDETRKLWPDQHKGLYNWWRDEMILSKVIFGHRYHGLLCLCWYAVKCGVPIEDVKADMERLRPYLDSLQPDHPMSDDDFESALKAYKLEGKTVPFKTMLNLIGVEEYKPITRRREKGRRLTQAEHLAEARRFQAKYRDPNWRNMKGQPIKADIVRKWREEHPEGKKIDCERETGLSRHTVLKWWDG